MDSWFGDRALHGAAGRLPAAFDGFVVTTETGDRIESERAVRAAIRHAFGSDAGWRFQVLDGAGNEVDATPPPDLYVGTVGEAFEYARCLQAASPGLVAEPSFDGPGADAPGRRGPAAPDGPQPDDFIWHLQRTRVIEAWRQAPDRGAAIRIGHPDTGYTRHEEIWDREQPRILPALGYDFLDGSDPLDPLEEGPGFEPGHGTSTASVLMSGCSDRGVWGAAPAARLVPFRVSRGVIHLSLKRVAQAIRRAQAVRCQVVSMSLGGPFRSAALHRAIRAAVDDGMILVAAARNYWPWVVYPAAYDEVIAVAATTSDDRIWRWSATGEAVDVAAPGAGVWVARPTRSAPDRGDGTSYAAALTAGVAALWLAKHGHENLCSRLGRANVARAFRRLAQETARPGGGAWRRDRHGAGILDANALLAAAVPGADGAPVAPAALLRKVASPWCHYLEVDRRDVENGLDRLIDGAERLVPPEADPSGLGAELAAHLALDPLVREEVEAASGHPPHRAFALRGSAAAPRGSALLASGSAQLRAALRRA